ncbi:MAG: MFS transporter [Spirochaetaceae bacterium]|nr:MFS transporter [Spirochaetaceae bacterium]
MLPRDLLPRDPLPRDPQSRSLFAALVLHIGVMGGAVAALGALIPEMIRDFGWPYTHAGLVVAAGSAAFVLSTTAAGFVLPRLDVRLTVTAGLLLEVLGLLLFGAWPGVALTAAVYALLGVGFGAMEVAGNELTISMERGGRGQLMNLVHAAFAVGGITVTWTTSWFLQSGGDWRLVYRLLGGATLLVALFLLTRPALAVAGMARGAGGATPVRRRGVPDRSLTLLMMILAAMGVYVGIELGVAAWMSEFVVAAIGGSVAQGARIVSLYWVGLCLGRVGTGILHRGTGHAAVILALAAVAVVGLTVTVSAGGLGWAAAGAVVTGIGLSALYPLLISLAGSQYPTRRSQAMGLTAASGGLGSMLVPLAITVVADAFGIRSGMFVYLGLAVILTAVSAALLSMTRRDRV